MDQLSSDEAERLTLAMLQQEEEERKRQAAARQQDEDAEARRVAASQRTPEHLISMIFLFVDRKSAINQTL